MKFQKLSVPSNYQSLFPWVTLFIQDLEAGVDGPSATGWVWDADEICHLERKAFTLKKGVLKFLQPETQPRTWGLVVQRSSCLHKNTFPGKSTNSNQKPGHRSKQNFQTDIDNAPVWFALPCVGLFVCFSQCWCESWGFTRASQMFSQPWFPVPNALHYINI